MKSLREIAFAENQRLDECVREPIRTPGSIQSHGVLLVLGPDARTIIAASDNSLAALGASPAELLGTDFDALLGDSVGEAVREVVGGALYASNPVAASVDGTGWDLIVHSSGAHVLVEFEPVLPAHHSPSTAIAYETIRRLSLLNTVTELRDETVRAMSHLSGFDKVMLYHFHPDGHGEVVAEQNGEGMEPYLGLHFPASDIPAQARALYLTKVSRSIVSSDRPVSQIIGSTEWAESPMDLSLAELRSVSPYHLQFMRNMRQGATLSFSLIRDGELIGMITCAHRTERRLPFALRSTLEVLANQVAVQLRAMDEIAALKEASRLRELRTVLVREFTEAEDPLAELQVGAVSLFDVLPADGALCRIDGRTLAWGITPPREMFEVWWPAVEGVVATESLGLDHPELSEMWPDVAGLLVVPLGGGDYLALFRQEVIQTVDWLGDLSSANRPDPLSPRLSFSSWTQSVKGTSLPWGAAKSGGAELGRELESALRRRSEAHLVMAAFNDSLTGLPNRRFLQERLSTALAHGLGATTALLFIDLDRFKIINDSLGHDVGDALLVEVGQRLASTARQQDIVARLGGDEFVLVCAETTLREAQAVSERILESFRRPLQIGENILTISASIGIAIATSGASGADLIKQADASMYRAKARGGDRASV